MDAAIVTENLPRSPDAAATPVVAVSDLAVTFVQRERTVAAVNGVSFELAPGEVLTILGESGSGKSVTLRALMGLLPPHARVDGRVEIAGYDLYTLNRGDRARLRGPVIAMIFQEPMSALDPVFTIGDQIAETIIEHEGIDHRKALKRALELLEMVRIPSAARRLKNYPHEMSGGMRQRAMIALALACRPSVLLADEPTTALDVTVQIQILLLLRELQKALGMAVVFVTHDVGVAAEIADRVAVMYGGQFVETGTAGEVMGQRLHPYTEGLLASTVHGGMRGQKLEMIGGQPPNPSDLPPGCTFAPRCTCAVASCHTAKPPPILVAENRFVRCVRAAPQTFWGIGS
jgi:peptide/nickel transport system ATP-binding protein